MSSNKKHLPADERRAVTVETVIELAAEQNPNSITTAAIAERMNLTQGSLFRHFPNKEAIWQMVMEWVADRLLARVDKAAKASLSPMVALEAIYMTHIDFVIAHPGVPRMLFGELQRAEDTPAKKMVCTLMEQYGKRLAGVIERGKAEGAIDPKVDTSAAALLFLGSIQGLVMQSQLAGEIHNMRDKAAALYSIYLRGIGSDI